MRVLVTGGAGAIGCNLVRALTSQGAKVTVLDDLSSGRLNVPPGVKFVCEDILDIDEAMKVQYDEIYHLAASFANERSLEFPVSDFRTNAYGTLHLLELALRQGRLKCFLFASSSSVEGKGEDEFTTPYMISKFAAELYCRFYQRGRLPVRIVRYFNCYGPGEYPGKYRNVVINFISLALRGQALVITGTGGETRDFTYVDDIVAGTLAVARSAETASGAYAIGTGKETSILALAELINQVTGNKAPIKYAPRRGWDKTTSRIADVTRTTRDSGFSSVTTLETGIQATVKWFRENRA